MKIWIFLTALAALGFASTSAFASSVCIIQVPDDIGEAVRISCDGGKVTSPFKVENDYLPKQTALLQAYVEKGYRIVSEAHDASSDQYTLVHD